MLTRRGLLTLLLVVTIVGASTGAVVWRRLVYLPDPSQANREQLLRWIVLRDLSNESSDIRLSLVDRLIEEMDEGLPVEKSSGLSDSHRQQLIANAKLLQDDWFNSRVDAYSRLGEVPRFDYLQEQIATMHQWAEIEGALHKDNGQSATAFFGRIDDWLGAAKGERKQEMSRAVHDGLICWLATRDLSEHSMSTRTELAERIAEQLNRGKKADESLFGAEEHRRQLVDNSKLLMEAWLHERAVEFAALSKDQRNAFVDQQIDNVTDWGVLDLLSDSTGAQPSGGMSALLEFNRLVTTWIDRASSEKQEPLRQLVDSVKMRLVWRQMSKQSSPTDN